MAPHVKRAIETQALTFRERDVYEIVQGLRAAAYGVPFLPAPGGEASDYMKVNRTLTLEDPETGRRIPAARAIRPDVALLHARVADRKGNLRIDDPYADDLLARATHARGLTYINCVGAVNPDIREASPTSVDPRLLDACEGTVTLPDMFDLARRGRIDLMFLGAAQVDAEGRANSTCIGDFTRPRVKLPGPAGSSSMRAAVPKVVIGVPRHSSRSLPERVDFATSVPSPRNQTTVVLTDLTRFDLRDGRLRVASRRNGVTLADLRAATGFSVEEEGSRSPAPTVEERRALERLDPAGIRHRMI